MEARIVEREDDLINQINIRHKIANDLHQTQYIYQLMIANLPNMSFLLFDRNLKYILAGGQFLEKTGYKKEEVEGKYLDDVIKIPEIRDRFKKYFNLALDGTSTNFDGQTMHGIWYHTRIVPMYDHKGLITGGMVINEDISERKAKDIEIQETESRFRQLADNIKSGFWLASADGEETLYISPALSKIFNQKEEFLITDPKSFTSTIHPDDVSITQDNRLERIYNNKYDVEYRVVKDNGEIRWIWSRAFPVKDHNGNIIRTAGIVEDITDRKKLEDQALQLGIEKQTIKILANFIRDTAHDLKTPLTIIRTSTYILEKTIINKLFALSPDNHNNPSQEGAKQHHLSVINKQVDRLKIIIDQLQNMAQLDSIEKLEFKDTDIVDIVNSISKNEHFRVLEKKQTSTLVIAENIPHINGNGNNLYMAITNIYDNAILYTPEGGSISVNVYINNMNIVIDIRDTGVGIPSHEIDKIFKRFYKINQARTSNNSGAGLGLSMAQLIVERHSGTISVESKPDEGSLFRIKLPIT